MKTLADELNRLDNREELVKAALKARDYQRRLANSNKYVAEMIAANPFWVPTAEEDEFSIARREKAAAERKKYLAAQQAISDRYSKLKASARLKHAVQS